MKKILLTGASATAPEEVISNQELVTSFNQYVKSYNEAHAAKIAGGLLEPLKESSEAFILSASGILRRHVIDKKGILDPAIMQPIVPERRNDQLSLQAEMAVNAAKIALSNAHKTPEEVPTDLSCRQH